MYSFDIVGFGNVLANRTINETYNVEYDNIGLANNIVYIVRTVLANCSYNLTYDVVYNRIGIQ